MESASDCVFCRIVAGELPSERVYEDERTVAFMDINPTTRGHALVIPRAHSGDLLEIGDEDLAACMRTAQRVARLARERLDADGVNLLQSTGRAASQVVFHFHVHVVPRYRNDGVETPFIRGPGEPAEIAEVAARLRGE